MFKTSSIHTRTHQQRPPPRVLTVLSTCQTQGEAGMTPRPCTATGPFHTLEFKLVSCWSRQTVSETAGDSPRPPCKRAIHQSSRCFNNRRPSSEPIPEHGLQQCLSRVPVLVHFHAVRIHENLFLLPVFIGPGRPSPCGPSASSPQLSSQQSL